MDLIKLMFLQFTIIIVLFGTLMNVVEKYLPPYIKQMFRYGKHSYKGKNDKLIKTIEIPKSWFKHFYIFALIWTWLGLFLTTSVYYFGYHPHRLLLEYLDFSCGNDREIETKPLSTLAALILITIQCTRRFIETNFLQIFSRKSKMNLTHYICGFLHYYGLIVLIIAKSRGFKIDQNQQFNISYEMREITVVALTSIGFMYMCYKQFETNMIFINLRKTKTGTVVTEDHLLPKGGWFKYVSSPHMTSELGMYIILLVLLYGNTSYIYCLSWVVSNQISNAILTHKWYLETFKSYPKERKAIIPFLL